MFGEIPQRAPDTPGIALQGPQADIAACLARTASSTLQLALQG